MRIDSIEIEGFGKLTNFRRQLRRGVNLFSGENEAGKSTLQQAILALLYGFYSGDRASQRETAYLELFRPWQANTYRASLEYTLDNSERFRIERDFGTVDTHVRILELPTGRDITASFGRGRHGNVAFAREHLGLTKEVFRGTAFVGQGEVGPLSGEAARIAETVVSLADTGRADASATRAIAYLDGLIRTRIGTNQARTTELPQARRRLLLAQEELANRDEAWNQVVEAITCKQQKENELADTLKDLERLDLMIVLSMLDAIRARQSQLEKLDKSLQESREDEQKLQPHKIFPSNLFESIVVTRGALEQAQTSLTGLESNTSAPEEVQNILNEIRSLQSEIADLEFVRSMPEDLEVQVRSLESRWRADKAAAAPEALRKTRRQQRRYISLGLLVAGLVVLASYFLVPPDPQAWILLVGSILVLASGAAWLLIRSPVPLVAADVQSQLLTLIRMGGVEQEDPEAALVNFYERARRRQRLTLLETQLQVAIDKRERFTDSQRLSQERQDAITNLGGKLHELYAQAGITDVDLNTAWATFQEYQGKRAQYDDVVADLGNMTRERAALLGDKTPGQLSAEATELQTRRNTILANNPLLADLLPQGDIAALRAEWQQLDKRRQALELEIAKLDTQTSERMRSHRPRAEIEEDLARYQQEAEFLERTRRSLEIAKQTIEEAAQEARRDFAPALNETLARALSEVTQNRYTEALVDPATFDIRIRIPETGRLDSIDKISFGARELVWFHLRLGLAQLMSSLRESVPVILDDCLVNLDSARLARALDFLAAYSEDHQVLLFSKSEEIQAWFDDRLAGDQNHCLYVLDV